jgi:hypothetical protein
MADDDPSPSMAVTGATTPSAPPAPVAPRLRVSQYRTWRRLWGWGVTLLREIAFAGAAGLVAVAFYTSPRFNALEGARFSRVLAHLSNRPYVARILLPFVSFHASRLFDPTVLLGARLRHAFAVFAGVHNVTEPDIPTLGFIILFGVLALRAAMTLYARLLRRLGGLSEEAVILLTVLSFISLRMVFEFGDHFFYDPMTILLGTSLLYWLELDMTLAFAVTFVVAMLNKETAFIFIPVGAFVVAARRKSLAIVARWTVVHALLAGLAFGSILWVRGLAMSGNAPWDNFLRDNTAANLAHFVTAETWMDFRNWLALLFAGWLVFRRFGERPLVLRAGMVGAVVLLSGYVRGSLYGEGRVFYEVFCPISMLAAVNLAELTRSAAKASWVQLRERVAIVVGVAALSAINWAAVVSALKPAP